MNVKVWIKFSKNTLREKKFSNEVKTYLKFDMYTFFSYSFSKFFFLTCA